MGCIFDKPNACGFDPLEEEEEEESTLLDIEIGVRTNPITRSLPSCMMGIPLAVPNVCGFTVHFCGQCEPRGWFSGETRIVIDNSLKSKGSAAQQHGWCHARISRSTARRVIEELNNRIETRPDGRAFRFWPSEDWIEAIDLTYRVPQNGSLSIRNWSHTVEDAILQLETIPEMLIGLRFDVELPNGYTMKFGGVYSRPVSQKCGWIGTAKSHQPTVVKPDDWVAGKVEFITAVQLLNASLEWSLDGTQVRFGEFSKWIPDPLAHAIVPLIK